MADRYKCFAELAANERLGIDYRICVEDRGAPLVVFAPHGGWIEPNTSEIAEAVAGLDFSFYAFEGLENRPHTDLHITSHRFDEPTAIRATWGRNTGYSLPDCYGYSKQPTDLCRKARSRK